MPICKCDNMYCEGEEYQRKWLLECIKPGDTIYTILKHVSRSGMYRVIDLYIIKDNQPLRISWAASHLLEGYDRKHKGCKVGGCGMDTGYHLVHNLSIRLFPDGFKCTGQYCPHNSHANPPYPPRDGLMQHEGDIGYTLKHQWL